MEPVFELQQVNKAYKDFSLRNLNLKLEPGYIMGFIGPNGAGKSTTIKLIMNLIRPDDGEVRVFGKSHQTDSIAIKEQIGFVYDESHYYEELTCKEMARIVRPFYSRWEENSFQKLLREFGLPADKPIKQLSKGMKMKFSLAIALSHQAELLIMDEPTSGLDPMVRHELLEILQSLIQDERRSVFFSTHITSDLDKIADYITIIHNGEILLSQTKDELLEKYTLVKGSKDQLAAIDSKYVVGMRNHAYGFEALISNKRMVQHLRGSSLLLERPTLEEIMLFTIRGRDSYVPSY